MPRGARVSGDACGLRSLTRPVSRLARMVYMSRRFRQLTLVLAFLLSFAPGAGRAAAPAGSPVDARAAATAQMRGLVGTDTSLGIVTNAVSRAQSAPGAPLFAELLA